ncbi:MAG TPA: hypothetical protein VF184_00335 [Phycisphaeraceae bacterium]
MTTLYLATGEGPVIVTQRGNRWLADRPLDVLFASCIAADPRRPQRVFCTTARDGVWRSDDAGASWQRVLSMEEGSLYERITAVAVSAAERVGGLGVVYVGTEPSAVLRSEDDGKTWTNCKGLSDLPSSSTWRFPPRPHTHHVRWIEPDPHDVGRLYVAVEAGALIRSPDSGVTWQDRVPSGPYDTHQLATHLDVPGRLWSAAGDGFFESDDAGQTWQKAEQGLRHRYCWSVAVDPRDPEAVVLSCAAGPRQAHDIDQAEAHLYRRSGGGDTWQEVREGLPDPKGTRAYALAADPVESGVFYAGADGALYRSADAGASWSQLPLNWPASYSGSRIHVLRAVKIA